ncbi:MAG: carbohydrate kinase family protein [Candidatus Aminicenantes bacterium]|nr:carbohydrate kinase family protein [Candidatus Aminicenantes bacterium]
MMDLQEPRRFGLIGTITLDHVSTHDGRSFVGLGGVLYQAAALCGLGEEVSLYSLCGRFLQEEVETAVAGWTTLRREGIVYVAGPGNQVRLHYPARGERQEVLESAVPPLKAMDILPDLPRFNMLLLVLNSGFDIDLPEWRAVVAAAPSPIWLDIHSLALFPATGILRSYRPLPEWTRWAEGVTYLQANLQEVACMLERPERFPDRRELKAFAHRAFDVGVEAVFVTLGKEGVRILTPKASRKVAARDVGPRMDSTGCGDIFCAGAMSLLARRRPPRRAAAFGVSLASLGVTVSGVVETFRLISELGAVLSTTRGSIPLRARKKEP